MPRRPAAQDWIGTPTQALSLLRVELSYLLAAPSMRLLGTELRRHPVHARWLRSIPGSYARRLGVLCAAAPEQSRAAIKRAFSEVLSAEQAAEMRGVADGTEYAFDVEVAGAEGFCPGDQVILDSAGSDGVRRLAYCRRVPADRQGAEELREQIEREAWDAGAESVSVRVRAA
ncbi:hypothetical protein [Sorangium sp. So ce388]|uniref:hypothetical protein n=1 Tax=Sorangium sp. So ce388 TaxID=3133309 RepID=UPI003F5B076B